MDDLSPWRGRRGQRGRRAALSCLAAVALLVPAPVPANSPAALERAIQANFLFKFAPFVEWPPAAFSGTERNFVICVEIGRASCRERVCQYVYISVVAV